MPARSHSLLALLAGAMIALVIVAQGQTTGAESVTCSSAARPAGRVIDLSGSWKDSTQRTYTFSQVGTCLWWAGGTGNSVVFFGTVFGSTITGTWADVSNRKFGGITLVIRSSTKLIRRGSAGDFRPTSFSKG
jgi:hypothetical protein